MLIWSPAAPGTPGDGDGDGVGVGGGVGVGAAGVRKSMGLDHGPLFVPSLAMTRQKKWPPAVRSAVTGILVWFACSGNDPVNTTWENAASDAIARL